MGTAWKFGYVSLQDALTHDPFPNYFLAVCNYRQEIRPGKNRSYYNNNEREHKV